MKMKTSLLLVIAMLALVVVAGQAFAQGCGMPGMNHGAGPSRPAGSGPHHPAGQWVGQPLPPAENMISLAGTVISIAPNGAALVDTGTAKVYVMACTAAPTQDGAPPVSPFKVGDRIQVAGVLAALTIQPATGDTQAQDAQVTQARFRVDNILCGACAASVQQALQAAPGVKQASVTTEGIATVGYDPAVTNPQKLAQVIVRAKHPHGLKFKATLLPYRTATARWFSEGGVS